MLDNIIGVISFVSIFFLFSSGFFFSIRLNWLQLNFKMLFKSLKGESKTIKDFFTSLSLSMAARIGVGSLSGIALAIYYGGPGSIFWIWVLGLITSINTYCETYLGVKYQRKDGNNYIGGPAFYMQKAFNNHFISKIYALIVILTYIFGFMTIQSNTIVISLNNSLGVNKLIITIVLSIITFLSIIKGLNRVKNITNIIIPFMEIIYFLILLIIVFLNYYRIPYVLSNIIKSAFNFKSFCSGFMFTFLIGMQRGIFCTESGLGTSSIASSTINPCNKIKYSTSQILGIYFTIFVICTSTALIILTSNYDFMNFNKMNGIELVQYSINYHFGCFGIIILLIIVICLAYSTIVAGYYYGESNLTFLKNKNKKSIIFLKIISVITVTIGGLINANIIWNIVDIFVSLLGIINVISLFKLRNEIVNDYEKS